MNLNRIKYFFISNLFIFTFCSLTSHAQSNESIGNNWNSNIGPFVSKFELPSGWKDGEDALLKATNVYDREGMNYKVNLAFSNSQDAVMIASWQDFKPTVGVEVAQLTSETPNFTGIRKSDVKMSSELSSGSNKFEYALIKGTGSGDSFVITGKGKIRYVGYWIYMPVQYKGSKGELFSGMLSLFGRVNEQQINKIKIDSVMTTFINSLELNNGFTKLTYDAHKNEVVEMRVRKKIEAEMAQSSNKDGKTISTTEQQSAILSTVPMIKDIYAVDQDGNCYRPTDKEGLKKIICPVHKSN